MLPTRLHSPLHRTARAWLALAVLAIAWPASSVSAQEEAPRAVLLRPVLRGDDVDGVGHALERVLRTRLGEYAVVRLGPTPALDLADLQLAVGCVAESRECLTLVVTQLEVDVLLMLGVERAGSELVVTLARFHRGGGDLEATTRRVPGPNPDAAALDEMDSLVRQAFGLGPASVAVDESSDAASDEDAAIPGANRPSVAPTSRSDGSEIVAPLLLLGLGAAGLATGIGLGVASENSSAAYAAYLVDTRADVDTATAIYQRAEREAIAADVLMPVGGALVVAGAIVWILQEVLRADRSDTANSIGVEIAPSAVAVTITGRFDGSAR